MTTIDSSAAPGMASAISPKLAVPHFSLGERDRRWARVRQLMERDNLDVLVAPSHTGAWDQLQANVRYLTGIGGGSATAGCVFPRDPADGEVTALVGPIPPKDYWLRFQDWVTDVRPGFFSISQASIDRLKEHPAVDHPGIRIGVPGLGGMIRMPEGIVATGTFRNLHETFPQAELVDATHLMDEARYVKSDEEIAFMRQAITLVERAIDTLRHSARPGVPECVVFGRMLSTLVEGGSDVPTMLLWSVGNPQPPTNGFVATQRPLATGDVFAMEIDGRWGGYIGQVTQPAVLGRLDDERHEMWKVQQEAVARCYERLTPGASMAEFVSIGEEAARGTPFSCSVIIHSRGLGNDAPMVIFNSRDRRQLDWPILENATFILKPLVRNAAGEKPTCWGDTVVATSSGARRLGSQPSQFIEIEP